MYVQFNTEARSHNHCCRGKAVRIKYYECLYSSIFSASYYIVICHLYDSTILSDITSYMVYCRGADSTSNKNVYQ